MTIFLGLGRFSIIYYCSWWIKSYICMQHLCILYVLNQIVWMYVCIWNNTLCKNQTENERNFYNFANDHYYWTELLRPYYIAISIFQNFESNAELRTVIKKITVASWRDNINISHHLIINPHRPHHGPAEKRTWKWCRLSQSKVIILDQHSFHLFIFVEMHVD
jgi:hypothetical protein